MRALLAASGVAGAFSGACLAAAWWAPHFAWPGVVLAALAAATAGTHALMEWTAAEHAAGAMGALKAEVRAIHNTLETHDAKLERLEKSQAFQALR